MALNAIKDAATLKEACRKMRDAFKPVAKPLKVRLGARPGGRSHTVLWVKELGIWFARDKNEKRYWNAFGTKIAENPSMVCEVNFAISGYIGSYGGAVAQDNEGALLLVHTGRIGGGREGISIKSFWANYESKKGRLSVGNHGRDVAIIGAIESPEFLSDLATFVHEVERIKFVAKVPKEKSK